MDRLTHLSTLRIDGEKRLSLIYRGRTYRGFVGDTVATALYGNGIRIFSRSIKYHRPRGLYSLDGESSNCLMDIDGIPNVAAEKMLLRNGMRVKPQNVTGSPEMDLMGFLDKMDWALPAGFYYRYFHKPYKLWPFFLNRIRKAAGLGILDPASHMEGRYDERYLNCDVCVVGGGPAGMQAALAAAEQGLRVILLEARPWLGGFFDYRTAKYDSGVPLYERGRELAKKVISNSNIRIFCHTSLTGLYSNSLVTGLQIGGDADSFDERYLEIRARGLVAATGCSERPLIFENNERPGVMQMACAHRLAHTYGLLPGERAVFCVAHDLGLEAAMDLFDVGMDVACVADSRTQVADSSLIDALIKRNISYLPGYVALEAHGKTLKRVTLCKTKGGGHKTVDCDTLVATSGLIPASGLLSLVPAKSAYDPHTGFFLPIDLPSNIHAGGRLLGFQEAKSIETSGRLAGLNAAADCGANIEHLKKDTRELLEDLPGPVEGSHLIQAPGKGRKRFVCFDEDVTVKNIHQTCDQGFDRPELAKRFSAAGTGPAQSGIPGHNLPLLISEYRGEPSGSEVPTTVRSPLVPPLLATYAGRPYEMFKRTPAQERQEKAGAIFRKIGAWKRARYFSKDFSAREEIENVRNNVGLIDVSTLGKFRIFGPDALKALQRVYVGDMSKIPEGKVKYSAMCNDDGCLLDDGVITPIGQNDFYFTTSTGRADSTVEWIRYHARYEEWDFHLVNLTDAYGAINLAGPNSRSVLQKITDEDLTNEAFPYTGYREINLEGEIPARVFRLGFVGELSYEIHMPSSMMPVVWDLLLDSGSSFGIRPFGLEAQNALRMEKGHVIIGQESEIRTTLHDLGLGFLWYRHKPEAKTVGAPSLKFTENQKDRMKLVGLEMENPARPPKDGSIIVDQTIRGHVCTARFSYTLKKAIGLALVEDSISKMGTRVAVFEDGMGDERLYATIVPVRFFDPEGERLRM